MTLQEFATRLAEDKLQKSIDNQAKNYFARHNREQRESVVVEYPEADGNVVVWKRVAFGTRQGASRWLSKQAFKGARLI